MALSHSPKIVTDGLILCLDAGDGKSYSGSGNTWTDRSGQNRNGTLKNMEGSDFDGSDKSGSLTFGGTDEKVEIDHFDYDRTNFTAEAVGKFNANHTDWRSVFFSKWQTGAGDNNEWFFGGDGASGPSVIVAAFEPYGGGSAHLLRTSYNYVVGTLYHISITFNNGEAKLYVNGNLEDSDTCNFTEVRAYSGQKFNIAGFYSNYYTLCTIYLARMYNKALTADEVLQNYNATKGRFS
jgi:hypothetical protein